MKEAKFYCLYLQVSKSYTEKLKKEEQISADVRDKFTWMGEYLQGNPELLKASKRAYEAIHK